MTPSLDWLSPTPEGVPNLLRRYARWLLWTASFPDGKKQPSAARSPGRPADATDPANWCTFEDVLKAYISSKTSGIGFALGRSDDGLNFAGVDLDDCRDPATGAIASWASAVIHELGSYAEVSPSGTGVKIFLLGTLPEGAPQGKRGGIEIYDRGRYFTVTGRAL